MTQYGDYELPAGWKWAKLGELCERIRDTLDPRQHPEELFAHYSMPAFDEGAVPRLEVGASIQSAKLTFPCGAVLFSRLNPRISRVWYVCDHQTRPRICSTDFVPLAPDPSKLNAEYLTYALRQPDLIGYLRRMTQAATKSRERLAPAALRSAVIPLPPIPEQKRIAAILTEQMAAVDRARAAAEAQLRAAQELPAAYLRDVFESDEAKGWPVVPLGRTADIVSGVTLGRSANSAGTRPVPYLRVANVKDGYLDLTEVHTFEATEAEVAKCQLRHGDILLTEGGDRDKLGRGTLWEGQLPECIHQNHIFRARFDQHRFCPLFVSLQLGSAYGRAYFLAHGKQTTGIATINQKVLKAFPLMAPPLGVQDRIAADLNGKLLVAEQSISTTQAQLAAINELPAALLRKAFRGEL